MKKTLIIFLSVLLLAACGNNREKDLDEIKAYEARISMFDVAVHADKADTLTGLYRHFIEEYPDDSLAPLFMLRMAEIAINTGDNDEAIDLLDNLENTYSDYEDLAGCLFLKGQAYEANEQYNEARECYTRFVENYPDHYLAADTRRLIPLIGLTPEEQLEAVLKQANTENGNQ